MGTRGALPAACSAVVVKCGGMGGGNQGGGGLGGGGLSGEVAPRAGQVGWELRARCRGRIRGPLPAAVARAKARVGGGEAVRAEGYR